MTPFHSVASQDKSERSSRISDDTLTDESRILPETFDSLWRLKEKGYYLAVVSGRPAGWADCLMRLAGRCDGFRERRRSHHA